MSETGPAAAEVRPRVGTPVDGVEVLGSLSPSRAADFRACPLMYRLRTIDRIAEQPSPEAVRGTVVHRVLEELFELPAGRRTPEVAEEMVQAAWEHVLENEPEAAGLFLGDADGVQAGAADVGASMVAWLASCREKVRAYFELEDPRRLEPAEREVYVETLLDSRLLLRGIVDRLDVAPDGAVRVVDYKTGSAPPPGFETRALFQMRFYALVLWRTRGVVPSVLQLLYLGDGQRLEYSPDVDDLRATERLVGAVWEAIEHARTAREWRPNPGWACRYCGFQPLCPAFGGTPPPLPPDAPEEQLVSGPAPPGPPA